MVRVTAGMCDILESKREEGRVRKGGPFYLTHETSAGVHVIVETVMQVALHTLGAGTATALAAGRRVPKGVTQRERRWKTDKFKA